MRLSDVIKEFLSNRRAKGNRAKNTAARYEITLRNFALCMHDPDFESIDYRHVMWYLGELERLGWKSAGRQLIAIAIKKLIEFANIRGYKTFNEQLIPIPERQFSIPRVTTLEKFKKLLAQTANPNNPYAVRDRAILLLLWSTGARSGEVCSIDVDDLDLKNKTAIIKTEKSRGRRPVRQIFWTEETGEALNNWLRVRERLSRKFTFTHENALFISIAKSKYYSERGRRLSPFSIAEIMRVLSNKAGLPTVNAHSIRHSMGRDIVKEGMPSAAVSSILGHSSMDSSYVYSMLFGNDLKDEWDKVQKRRRLDT